MRVIYVAILLLSFSYSGYSQIPTASPVPSPVVVPSPVPIEEQLKKAQEINQHQIKDLSVKLTDLEKKLTTGTLESKLASLTEKVEALEKINKLKNQGQIINDEAKFKAGLETLDVMIGNIKKLDFAGDLVLSVERFQTITNPSNNQAFMNEIQTLRGDKLGLDNSLQNVSGPLLSNPYVSLAWSIGATLVSKFSKSEKPAKLNGMICVLDVATRTDADLKIIRSDLTNLGERMNKFNKEMLPFFEGYTGSVGKTMTYANYKASQDADGPMTKAISDFFAKYRADNAGVGSGTPTAELTNVRYRTERLKTGLVEYDSILKQMDDFLAKFADMLAKHESNIPTCAAIPTLKIDFETLKKKSQDLRPKFEEAYRSDVKAAWRSILYVN